MSSTKKWLKRVLASRIRVVTRCMKGGVGLDRLIGWTALILLPLIGGSHSSNSTNLLDLPLISGSGMT